MTTGTPEVPLCIVIGSDNAGHAYKTALEKTLRNHSGVARVLGIGVAEPDDSTAYPHLAIDACMKIKAGEVFSPPYFDYREFCMS